MKVSDYISSIIIMLCHLCVVVPCFYYSCSLDWKPKDDRPFMVFLPPGACTMPEFQRILLTYREKVRRFTYVELAITPLFWFLSIAGQLILTTAAIIAYLMVPYFFGRRTRAELIALKKEKKWITEYTACLLYTSDSLRLIRTEEPKPGVQFVLDRFIVMDFPKNVKRDEEIFLQQLHLQTGIGALFKIMQIIIGKFAEFLWT